jgi:hypothetical protein
MDPLILLVLVLLGLVLAYVVLTGAKPTFQTVAGWVLLLAIIVVVVVIVLRVA